MFFKKRGWIWGITLLFLFVIGYSLFYLNQYKISAQDTSIQSSLEFYLNKEKQGEDKLKPVIQRIDQLGNTNSYVVLFSLNERLGYSHFIKGMNGKYKIDRSGYSSNIIAYEKIETSEGIYGIVLGKNPSNNINHINVELKNDNYKFMVNVANEKLFLEYKKLPSSIKQPFPANITIYDKNNNQIQ